MTTIPSLQTLKDTLVTDFQNEFNIVIPATGPSFLRGLCTVLAGVLWLCYKYLGNVQKNIFVDTADPDVVLRYGVVRLGRLPFPATQGQYTVTVNGLPGATIPASTTYKSDDNSLNPGYNYILDEAFLFVSGTGSVTLRALTEGEDALLDIGNTLTATAPIANVTAAAVVTAITVTPQSAETIEEYRAKVLISFRLEPQGGAGADYRIWGLDAQGTRQIYPYTPSGAPNHVNVYVEATIADSTDGMGTPTAQILLDVAADIEEDPDITLPIAERKRRPIGVLQVNVLPVNVLEVIINIPNFQDNNATKQALILTGLTEMIGGTSTLQGIRPFIASCDALADRNDILSNNNVTAAILNAVPGAVFGVVNITVNGNSFPSFTFDGGQIPFLTSVTYI